MPPECTPHRTVTGQAGKGQGGLGMKGTSGRHMARGGTVSAALCGIAGFVVAFLVTVFLSSCVGPGSTIVAPPQLAGATFVGNESCEMCHEDKVRRFRTATHFVVRASDPEVGDIGCESCHGPGSLHEESGGELGTILNPKTAPEVCFRCHLDKRAEFALPHSHPVTSGPLGLAREQMSCSACHDPHEGPALARGAQTLDGNNEGCLGCHEAQRGPFVFEHEAMRDGCTVCHEPHGSLNDKLLTERSATLCLKCHNQQQPLSADRLVIGGRNHSTELMRGACFSAGCHEAVHGSQVSSSLLY